jgi:hypothetical protein
MDIKIQFRGDLVPLLGSEWILKLEEGANLRTLSRFLSDKTGGRPSYIGNYRIDGGELMILINGSNIAALDGFETKYATGMWSRFCRPSDAAFRFPSKRRYDWLFHRAC